MYWGGEGKDKSSMKLDFQHFVCLVKKSFISLMIKHKVCCCMIWPVSIQLTRIISLLCRLMQIIILLCQPSNNFHLCIPGDGVFQDWQTAPDHLQLLPLLTRRGRPHHRSLLCSSVHGAVDHEEVALLRPPLRHLPRHWLSCQQRECVEPDGDIHW